MTVHHQTPARLGRRAASGGAVPIGSVHRERLVEANRILRYESSDQLAVAAMEIGLERMLKAKKGKGEE